MDMHTNTNRASCNLLKNSELFGGFQISADELPACEQSDFAAVPTDVVLPVKDVQKEIGL
jgi:hypothetical protein